MINKLHKTLLLAFWVSNCTSNSSDIVEWCFPRLHQRYFLSSQQRVPWFQRLVVSKSMQLLCTFAFWAGKYSWKEAFWEFLFILPCFYQGFRMVFAQKVPLHCYGTEVSRQYGWYHSPWHLNHHANDPVNGATYTAASGLAGPARCKSLWLEGWMSKSLSLFSIIQTSIQVSFVKKKLGCWMESSTGRCGNFHHQHGQHHRICGTSHRCDLLRFGHWFWSNEAIRGRRKSKNSDQTQGVCHPNLWGFRECAKHLRKNSSLGLFVVDLPTL